MPLIHHHVAGISLLLTACTPYPGTTWPRAGSPDPEPDSEVETLPPREIKGPPSVDATRGAPTLSGRVLDVQGAAVPGAQIDACGLTTVSDPDGWFRLGGAALTGCASVQARLPGQVPTGSPIVLDTHQHGTASLTLPPPAQLDLIPADEPRTLTSPNGASITFPGGGFTLADGSPWTEPVQVAWVHLHHTLTMRSAPGALADASGPLQSSGMVGVELSTPDGRALEFGGQAHLRLPPAVAPKRDDPSALYHWSEGDRHWSRAGEARLVQGQWEATVSSFSWWNIDKPADTRGCVSGFLGVPSDFMDLSGALVIASSETGVLNTARAARDGSFCVDLPEGRAELSARLVRDDVAWEWVERDLWVPGDGGECGVRACAVDVGTLEPEGRQLTCVVGTASGEGCLEFEGAVQRAWGVEWTRRRRWVEAGPFALTLPWSRAITFEGTPLTVPDHGPGAKLVPTFSRSHCADLGTVEPGEPTAGHTGWGGTGWAGTDCSPP